MAENFNADDTEKRKFRFWKKSEHTEEGKYDCVYRKDIISQADEIIKKYMQSGTKSYEKNSGMKIKRAVAYSFLGIFILGAFICIFKML